jgi:hypothetical protein
MPVARQRADERKDISHILDIDDYMKYRAP